MYVHGSYKIFNSIIRLVEFIKIFQRSIIRYINRIKYYTRCTVYNTNYTFKMTTSTV